MKIKQKSIKDVVRLKYNQIAQQDKETNQSSCCGSTGCCSDVDYTIFSEDYTKLHGYAEDADLGLGCGVPTEFAQIKRGDTVLDLGSGAGNDCFVARAIVGEEGKVIGLDFARNMLAKAKENANKLGYTNVEFIKGDIEEMPVESDTIDVVISNCVLNLVPNKQKAFQQIYRVLKNGAHFSVSDVVILGDLPETIKNDAEMYAGCVSGAIQKSEYIDLIKSSGFNRVEIQKEKKIDIPEDILLNYMNSAELEIFRNSGTGIYSITVYANK